MAKEVVISTSGLNCYGSRVLTVGIDLTQYQKNPVLLWMHRRSWCENAMPIGRIENLRTDGDKLIGTPIFDEKDEFAKKIADKWENGFLKMASAGVEILETSVDPINLIAGQTRPTVMRSRLEEVSIVDIGGNDDALQLTHEGKVLTFAAGGKCDALPLLELSKDNIDPSDTEGQDGNLNNNTNKLTMKKETLDLLGLSETATEQEIHEKIKLYKETSAKAESLELANVKAAVDSAIAEKRITEANREQFMTMGKQVGADSLRQTLELIRPAQRPNEVLNLSNDNSNSNEPKKFAKLSEVPAEQIEQLKKENHAEYAKLYKAEYGVDL